MLHIITIQKYFQRTGTGWLHATTESFYCGGSDTQYLLRQFLGTRVLVQNLRSFTKDGPADHQARSGRTVEPSECVVHGGRLLRAETGQ